MLGGANLHSGANLHPGANCAYEHGFSCYNHYDNKAIQNTAIFKNVKNDNLNFHMKKVIFFILLLKI